MPRVDLPDLVRQRASANGAAGQAWLDALPGVLDRLATTWNLTLGTAFGGGTAGYVVAATRGEGEPCVLKVAMPLDHDEELAFQRSINVHKLADGRGCARLLEYESAAPAMLLERLGPNLADLEFDVPQILHAIATTLRSFWQPLAGTRDYHATLFPTGAERAAWLADYIINSWDDLGQPCSREVVDRAVAYCDDRASAFHAGSSVVVHGDAHGWNTVLADGGRFKFVDPEGVLSEPAHDLSVPMREYNEPLLAGDTARLARERAEYLATLCDVDADAVWKWGFIERVSTGLANVRDFEGDDGLAFLEVAQRCL